MDIIKKIDILLQESSPYGSTEMTFHYWWNRENHIYYNVKNNEILYSSNREFPTGSVMDENSFAKAKELGVTLIPRYKY